jgi:hypothetical protein
MASTPSQPKDSQQGLRSPARHLIKTIRYQLPPEKSSANSKVDWSGDWLSNSVRRYE